MGVAFKWGQWAAWAASAGRAADGVRPMLASALEEMAAEIRDAVDRGPGGLGHVRTGHLNDSFHGENEDSVFELDEAASRLVIGSLDPAARMQARRFAATEGPVVPIDPAMVARVGSEHLHRLLTED